MTALTILTILLALALIATITAAFHLDDRIRRLETAEHIRRRHEESQLEAAKRRLLRRGVADQKHVTVVNRDGETS